MHSRYAFPTHQPQSLHTPVLHLMSALNTISTRRPTRSSGTDIQYGIINTVLNIYPYSYYTSDKLFLFDCC